MTDEFRPQVVVGDASGNHVVIQVLGRLHADARDFWDGNWLVTPIEIKAGDFFACIGASLRAEELRRFRVSLEELNMTLGGEAVLESMETWITLRVATQGSGHLAIDGVIMDQPGVGNKLSFKIDGLDVTHLPAMIESLEEMEAFFPVVGTP